MQRGYIRFNNDTKTVGGDTTPLTSADFGVYLSGTGTYNAPSRDVSYIAIPGRSQDIVHDNGRFNNITVTYPCFIYSNSQSDFDSKLADFRAYVKKFVGWVRLTDSYHPNEYRMVNADAEISVDVIPDHRAGEFQLSLTAQPYRYLTSGEAVKGIGQDVEYGDDPYEDSIKNNTNYVTEADFYFRRHGGSGVAGTIVIANSITTTTISIPAMGANDKEYMKFDAQTGMFLYATSNATEPYLNKEYSIIAEDISVTMTDYTYLPSVLAPGDNDITIEVTAGGSGATITFISYIPHWRTI